MLDTLESSLSRGKMDEMHICFTSKNLHEARLVSITSIIEGLEDTSLHGIIPLYHLGLTGQTALASQPNCWSDLPLWGSVGSTCVLLENLEDQA